MLHFLFVLVSMAYRRRIVRAPSPFSPWYNEKRKYRVDLIVAVNVSPLEPVLVWTPLGCFSLPIYTKRQKIELELYSLCARALAL